MQVQPSFARTEKKYFNESTNTNLLRRLIKGVLATHANRILTSESINQISGEICQQFADSIAGSG
jgi:hypothetical protein